ncbi:MAG: tyrosine-type recombinase/integrase [bacterium]
MLNLFKNSTSISRSRYLWILDQFKGELERNGKSKNTIVAYLRDIQKFGQWLKNIYDEEFLPDNITTHDIQDYKFYLLSVQNKKASTVNRKLASLSAFLDWCVAEEKITDNPMSRVKGIREVKTAPKALDRLDVKRLP